MSLHSMVPCESSSGLIIGSTILMTFPLDCFRS
jgi:hypothetical protein